MNYLQMYINLASVLIFASAICWFVVWGVHDGNNRRAKIASLVIATVTTLAALFCAAMAGLLS